MPNTANFEQRLRSARQLLENDKASDCEQQLLALLAEAPNQQLQCDALYLLAVAQRYQEKLEQALHTQGDLIRLNPAFARVFQERGHTLLSLNNLPDAQRAYEKAVNLNPALVSSWQALLNLYNLHDKSLNQQVERHQTRAKQALEYLLSLPPELVSVNSYLHENRLFEADQLCRDFMRRNQQHIEGMRLLAQIGERLGILTDAEFLLETGLALAPENTQLHFDYANLLLKMQKFEKACAQTTALVDMFPNNLQVVSLHANALAGVGEHRQAIAAYNQVIEAAPDQNTLLVMRGHAQKTIGQLADAVVSYQAACAMKPNYGDAWWSLANTKSYRFTDAELAQMATHSEDPNTAPDDEVHLCFALGKGWEDRQDYQQAFEWYQRGNALKQASVKHKIEFVALRASEQKRVCTQQFFEHRKHVGCADPAPIFVVGLPRAGSTLIEQILASHSQVDGTMELPNLIALAQRLRGGPGERSTTDTPRYPEILQELDRPYFQRFGEQFIKDTQVYRQTAPFFIDKNPNNFFHIGLIRLILPNAKVIDARRHPVSCCFSGFKQLFGQGQEFSYGLREIGHYYREYVSLMDHWDQVLPGFVLRVQHEAVVDDLEGQVRRMLDFCNLEFEESCLNYHKNQRSVRTPSSEQVRQPIFKTSLETWRHFEPWLDPLKEALGEDLRREYAITLK